MINKKSKLVKILTFGLLTSTLFFTGVFTVTAGAPFADPTPGAPSLPWNTFQQFLPVVKLEASQDLWIANLEITQGIQTLSNDVPLVEGRATALRIYAESSEDAPVDNVFISISASRNGETLDGSPLIIGPGTIPTSWDRNDIYTSFNVELPSGWLYGNVTLDITLDSNNTFFEKNENNNRVLQAANFTYVAPLNVTVIPIQYNDPIFGPFPPPAADFLADDLMKIYPVNQVNISLHSQISFNQSLSYTTSWNTLLNRITEIKQSESKPDSEVYYGLIPMKNSYGDTWFYGGVVGLGWVGYRAAIGLTNYEPYGFDGGDTAAHEIGHNLGRLHSPCGDPSGVDPYYPYIDGSIGEIGFKVNNFKTFSSNYKDVMSYCDPVWVSDYTYEGLFDNQVQVAAASAALAKQAPQEVLMVRASLDSEGEAELKPVYSFTGQPSQASEDSAYRIEFLDADGKLVDSQTVDLLWAEEEGIRTEAISARVQRPQQAYSSLRLVKDDQVLAEESLPQTSQAKTSQPLVMDGSSQNVLSWGASDVPALVRYSEDEGQTWTTLAMDVTGGELELEPLNLPYGDLLFQISLADQSATQFTLTWDNQE